MSDQDHGTPSRRTLSRRDFLKLLTAAGLLARCGPTAKPPLPTTAPVPTPTSAPPPTPTSTCTPTTTPAPTVTAAPTAPPTPTPAGRADIIRFYPDVPSRVVHIHHAGVWDGETLVPEALRQMLDSSITALTGLEEPLRAWATLFDPAEQVAIKVNTIQGSDFYTHVPLVMAVAERLQEIGVPAGQIVIFDRTTMELERGGYPINRDGPGVHCYGTDDRYTAGWTLIDRQIGLSDILLSCDALINMPIIKQHSMAGISFAMKNHYGTFDRPGLYHGDRIARGIAEVNALQPIRERTRLIVGDALEVSTHSWQAGQRGDSILMSFDPVAHDTVGLELYSQVLASVGGNPEGAARIASSWLEEGANLGIGTNDPDHIDLVEVTLG